MLVLLLLIWNNVNAFLLSAWTSVIGGIATKLWFDIAEEKVLVTRGKMALRDLELLGNHIVALYNRNVCFIYKYYTEDNEPSTIPGWILDEYRCH